MGPLLLVIAAQAAGAQPATAPDVEITAEIKVRALEIRQQGEIRVALTAEPGSTDIALERSAPRGKTTYRNLEIDARLAAWLTDPALEAGADTTTGETQP